jgi:hypothetical protein
MAPLQQRALYGLLFGIVWAIALALVFVVMGGANAFNEDANFRLIIDIIWIGGLILYWILFQTLRRPTQFDERDKEVMEWSSRAQWITVILSMVAWIVALSEAYRDEGQVPVIFLYLVFIFTLAASSIAQSVGVLIGYWSLNRHA